MKVHHFIPSPVNIKFITAQLFGYGGYRTQMDTCVVSFVFVHMYMCMYWARDPKHILGCNGVRSKYKICVVLSEYLRDLNLGKKLSMSVV